MGDRFVGSNDYSLAAAQAVTTGGFTSAWFDILEAEIHELEVTIENSSTDMVIAVRSDDGKPKALSHIVFQETFNGNQAAAKRKIPLGSHPGGRRIHFFAIMLSGTADLTLDLKESRSGLAG